MVCHKNEEWNWRCPSVSADISKIFITFLVHEAIEEILAIMPSTLIPNKITIQLSAYTSNSTSWGVEKTWFQV